ncbi:MAG: glycosyltransferase involved in cell wall biosynthesis [Mariniflexile sp.]
MNISFLLGDATAKGGIEKVTFTLASALNEYYKAKLISLYKTDLDSVFDKESIDVKYLSNHIEVSMYNRPYKGFLSYLFDLFYIIKKSYSLSTVLKKTHSQVIVTCDIKMTLLAWLSGFFSHRKVIAIEHFEYDVAHPILKKIRKVLYKKIAGVVTLTSEDYDKYYWLPKHKLHVIPNIVQIKLPTAKIKKKNDIIAVGRLTDQKGFDLLIKAWNIVGKQHTDWTLKIYGDGEDKLKLEKMIEEYEIKNISLQPFTKDIDQVYQQAKLFVLSSRYEGLGMVLIEALAHQLPCISFDCPAGPKTIIQHDYNGLLVPTGDITKLAAAMDQLLSSQYLRDKYSGNALNSIHDFSEESVLKRWNILLEGLANES